MTVDCKPLAQFADGPGDLAIQHQILSPASGRLVIFRWWQSEAGSWAKYRSSGSVCAGYFCKDFQEKALVILAEDHWMDEASVVASRFRTLIFRFKHRGRHLYLDAFSINYCSQLDCIELQPLDLSKQVWLSLQAQTGQLVISGRTAWGYLSGQSGAFFLSEYAGESFCEVRNSSHWPQLLKQKLFRNRLAWSSQGGGIGWLSAKRRTKTNQDSLCSKLSR